MPCTDRMDFILYGAASLGGIARHALERGGFHVAGYIDKRAFELSSYKGIPVWGADSVPEKYKNSRTFILISVKNVFEHEAVAQMLTEKGFQNIIYKPYSVLSGYGNKEECELAELYDSLFARKCPQNFKMPCIESEYRMHDFGFIREDNEMVTVFLPAEFLFVNLVQSDETSGVWGKPQCVLSMFAHIEFFRFLNNCRDASPDDYLEEYCVTQGEQRYQVRATDAWKQNVMENRMQVYEEMKASADLDAQFFIRNPAQAEWNGEKKCFNLLSGKHRCTFQVAMGKKYLPVKITKADYASFMHIAEVPEIMELLRRSGAETVIPHPAFYRGMSIRDRGEWSFLMWFARYYAKKTYFKDGEISFSKIRIIDYSSDYGNFARFCVRLGCRVWRKSHGQLEGQLNRLFYEASICYEPDGGVTDGSSIVVLESAGQEEPEQMDGVQRLLESVNTWILRYVECGTAERFAAKHSLRVAAEINQKYWQGSILKSYLLERCCDGTDGE